jgi:hydrogenase nickel insertion protein HypA
VHEVSLIDNILETVLPEVEHQLRRGEQVQGLAITIGAMELHSAEAFVQAFNVQAKNTLLADAELEVTIIQPEVRCPLCDFHGSFPQEQIDPHHPALVIECPACGSPAAVEGGRGVQKLELLLVESHDDPV